MSGQQTGSPAAGSGSPATRLAFPGIASPPAEPEGKAAPGEPSQRGPQADAEEEQPGAGSDVPGLCGAVAAAAALAVLAQLDPNGPDVVRTPVAAGVLRTERYALLVAALAAGKVLLGALARVWHRRRRRLAIQQRAVVFGAAVEVEASRGPVEGVELAGLAYLLLNTAIELSAVAHCAGWVGGVQVDHGLQSLGIVNGPLAAIVALVLGDGLCYHARRQLRRPALLPYARRRGRAGPSKRRSEELPRPHPLERLAHMLSLALGLYAVARTAGLHESAAWAALTGWLIVDAASSAAPHLQVHLPVPYPLMYGDRLAQAQCVQCNYGVVSTAMDRFCSTHRGWTQEKDAVDAVAAPTRPEPMPSAWSVGLLGLLLAVAATACELTREDGGPHGHEYAHLFRPGIVLANACFLCAATEEGAATFSAGGEVRKGAGLPERKGKAVLTGEYVAKAYKRE